MKFRNSLKYFLVHHLKISNLQAETLIKSEKISINNELIIENILINEEDEICLNEIVLQKSKKYFYYAYYKPRGIESTLNKDNPLNLITSTKIIEPFFPVGRLDKESEGLMLLTNNGYLYRKLTWPHLLKEKEYEVYTNEELSNEKLEWMSRGMNLKRYKTKPCKISMIASNQFRIILTEGKNRQIREMCSAVGLEVSKLMRTRIENIELLNLAPGEIRELSNDELHDLKNNCGLLKI